jgi:SAM-dependent methyltransferase
VSSDRSPIAIEAYTAVDAGRDPAALLATMDAVEALPGFREARELALDGLRLAPGQRVLDVGCGTGGALPAVLERISPGGEAVGVDLSETMIAEARRRWASPDRPLRLETADARALPFETGSFDACRTDRMMSHVPQPEAALAEMRRVTRPGGRIAVIDVDIETTIVDSPDPEVVRLAAVAGADRLQNGRIARHMESMLQGAGLSGVVTHPMFARVTLDVLKAMFADILEELSTNGRLDRARVLRWWAALAEQDRSGDLFALLPVIVVTGTAS